jgi:hypothetical protein
VFIVVDATLFAMVSAYFRPPFLPPLRELDLLRFSPPFFRPPLSDLFTVARARVERSGDMSFIKAQ